MPSINEIVQITITRQTAAAQVPAFNGVLIAEEILKADIAPAFNERVRVYTSLAELVTAGFVTTDAVYLAAQALFSQNPNPGKIYVGRKLTGVDGTETWTEALTAMADENKEWYGFSIGTKTLTDLQLAAAFSEANKKLFIISDDDANIVDGTGDIAEYVNSNSYDRSAVIYHDEADLSADDPMAEFAWMGKLFPKDPGSVNWAYKTLSGVTAVEITSAQQTTAFGKECNLYQEIAGNNVTRYGTVGSGEYIDIIRGLDWLESLIQSNIYTVLLNNDKIPFTDAGIQSIVAEIQSALQSAADVGLIIGAEDEENGYAVTAPLAADVSAANKAARILPDIEFRATLQGAVNKVEIQGYVGL